jgi:PEP-CTERM motif
LGRLEICLKNIVAAARVFCGDHASNLYRGWKLEGALLKKIPEVLFAIAGLALVHASPAASATLFGETLDANITISGEDDNGFYKVPVLVGPVVVGASGFSDIIPVFKQLTEDGFATASNQITGNVIVTIGSDTFSVEMVGQVQPFELDSKFSGIGGASFQIVADADSAAGVLSGVNMELFETDTAHSVDFATDYFGFQPGTDLTQTETLTFATGVGGAVPEPSTWMLLLAGFAGLGFAAVSRSRRRGDAAA